MAFDMLQTEFRTQTPFFFFFLLLHQTQLMMSTTQAFKIKVILLQNSKNVLPMTVVGILHKKKQIFIIQTIIEQLLYCPWN